MDADGEQMSVMGAVGRRFGAGRRPEYGPAGARVLDPTLCREKGKYLVQIDPLTE